MSKPSIPAVTIKDQHLASIIRPIKENIEFLTGVRTNRLRKIPRLLSYPIPLKAADRLTDAQKAALIAQLDPATYVGFGEVVIGMYEAIIDLVESSNVYNKAIDEHRAKINELIDRLNA